MEFSSLTKVKINFATSHLVFPHIMLGLVAILLVLVLITRRQKILAAISDGPYWPMGIDHVRFFGTIIFTVVYFTAMPIVGDIFPNTGMGFYLMSIPYIVATGVLYLRERSRRKLLYVGLNAIITPTFVWFTLSTFFNVTLP